MSNGPFADFQNEVYLKGLFGELPTLPFGWRDTEAAAYAATLRPSYVSRTI